MHALEAQGGIEDGEALIRLAYAEALDACGKRDEARAAIAVARRRIESVAAKITDPSLARSFRERVPENATTIALAAAWGAEPA
jgi:hypothetical protein